MTALELRTEIQQLLDQEENLSVLEAIRMLLRRGEPVEDDLTDEEVAELDRRHQDMVSGKVKALTEEEFMEQVRKGRG